MTIAQVHGALDAVADEERARMHGALVVARGAQAEKGEYQKLARKLSS